MQYEGNTQTLFDMGFNGSGRACHTVKALFVLVGMTSDTPFCT